jgi:hypothetical protein
MKQEIEKANGLEKAADFIGKAFRVHSAEAPKVQEHRPQPVIVD